MYLKLKIPQLLCYLAFLGISLISVETLSQTKGAISGKVIDAELKTELPGATIQIRGTTEGTTSDIYGKYFLSLAPGTYVVEVRFLGYETFTREVTITDRLITLDFSLSADVGTLDEVVVTAQNLGQRSAINRQIRSNSIVNIVSKDKIESLPDQNAAESVGRLPGVAIQRNGGEGQKVAIRGLSPRFNSITINGERLPSSDANDRSFDLSALSSDAIQGIELFKSWTPNLEGDAIGGTVNFVTKKADKDWNGKFRYLHGYNGQQQEFGQHRINFDIGNRFFSDKLGVLLSANYQRADRSQDRFGGDYNVQADVNNQGIEETFTENINLEDRLETRYRYGATASIDYTFDRGDIRLFTNYSQTDRDQIRRRRRYRFDSRRQEYELTDNQTENVLIANTLSGKYIFKNQLEVTMNGSYSRTRITTPFNHSVRFRENSAFENTTENFPDINEIIGLARNDLSRTFLQRARSDEDNIDFDRYSSQVDLKLPIKLFRSITGKIQAGGKIRIDRRVRDLRRFQARETDQIVSIAGADDGSQFPDKNETQIFFSNFEGDFVANSFLDGDFFLGPGSGNVNGGHLSERLTNEFFRRNIGFYERDVFVDGSDYKADESIISGYIMSELTISKKLNVLVGVRNETTRLDYIGYQIAGSTSGSEIEIGDDPQVLLTDSTLSRTYDEWLPSLNVKYQVNDWFDVRGAVTKTLSRPDFINLIPFVSIDLQQRQIQRGNFDLSHQTSLNYDLFLSFYNDFGLITIGGFYKEIGEADFVRSSRVTPITPGLGEESASFNGFELIQPENATENSIVQGIEVDLQTTLSSLPAPWNGFIFSANASFIKSETFYPVVVFASNPSRPINTERVGQFTGQPNQVFNFSIGYEKGGFSGRISMIHQGRTFGEGGQAGERLGGLDAQVQQAAILDQFVERTTRVDLAIKQKVYKNTLLFFNFNNITNQEEVLINRAEDILQRERFGFTMDLGLQYKF